MRTRALKTAFAALLPILTCGCHSSHSDAVAPEGFAARTQADIRWGVVDSEGQFIIQNAYDNAPTALVSGMYAVENADGQFLVYSASDPQNTLTPSPLEQVTAYFKNVAFATRRGTSIFILGTDGNPKTVLPDTVWEVKLAGDLRTVAAYRDHQGYWGILNTDGSVAEAAQYPSYEDFCIAHPDIFIKHPQPGESLRKKFRNIITVDPLSPPTQRVYAAQNNSSSWRLVNAVGEPVGENLWSEYAFPLCHGTEFVACQSSTGLYQLLSATDGRAGKIGDTDFAAVSCSMQLSVQSDKMYPQDGCTQVCDFLMDINLQTPDSVTTLIPLTSDAGYYHLTSVTFPDIQADVNIAKSTIDKSRRLMAVVKITPEGKSVSADNLRRILRNLMYAIEDNVEHRPGWERVGGESHALCLHDSRFLYLIPYNSYLVAVISTNRLDYKQLMGRAYKF